MADTSSFDNNHVPSLMAVSNADGTSPVKVFADPATHRLLVSATGGGTGTVTNVSVVSANGFAGTVANPTTTPAITVSTSINSPVLAGNGTALSAATTTGSGSTVVLSNTPTLVTPIIGAATGTSLALGGGTALTTTNQTGTGNLVLATAPTMSNPVVGTQTSSDNSTKAASTAYVTTGIANAIAAVNPAIAVTVATTQASDTSTLTYNNGVAGIGATLTGTNNTALTIDGVTLTSLTQRVLVKNDTQAPSGAFNGIYMLTQLQTAILPPILTRALDYDAPSDINNTGAIPVVSGTVNTTTSWLLTSNVTTVGTDPLTYVKFSANPTTVLSNTLTSAQVFVGNSSNVATGVAVSGDLTAANTGAFTVAKIAGTTVSGTTGTTNVVFSGTPTITTPVLTGLPTGTGVASAATASTLVARDSNANISGNNNIQGFTTTATAAGTTTLTVGSTYQQYFTGSTTQTVTLPVATTMVNGQQFFIANNSTGLVTVQTSGANSLIVLAASTFAFVTCINTAGGTGTASWNAEYRGVNITSGKVLAVTNTITLSGTDATTMTFPSTTQTVAGLTSTQTFTNKRVSRRVVTTTQSATPTINTDNTDVAAITGLAQAVTSFTTNLSGTPVAGDFLEIQVTDNGTARALTFGASFAASTVALPTTTVISTLLHILFEWDTTSSKWILVATA